MLGNYSFVMFYGSSLANVKRQGLFESREGLERSRADVLREI